VFCGFSDLFGRKFPSLQLYLSSLGRAEMFPDAGDTEIMFFDDAGNLLLSITDTDILVSRQPRVVQLVVWQRAWETSRLVAPLITVAPILDRPFRSEKKKQLKKLKESRQV